MASLVKYLHEAIKGKENVTSGELTTLFNGYEKMLENNIKQITVPVIRPSKFITTNKMNRGDVTTVSVGGYPHPGVVWKVKGDICYCLSFSTTEALHNLCKIENSRLFKSYVTKTVVEVSMEDAIKGFVTVFDNKKELATIFKKAKEYYLTLVR